VFLLIVLKTSNILKTPIAVISAVEIGTSKEAFTKDWAAKL